MSRKRTILAIAFAVLVETLSLARATDKTIILAIGTEGTTLMLERPFSTVLIGDPDVVDVLAQGDRSALVQPQGLGGTNIVFLDAGNIAIANVRVVVCETAARRISFGDQSECGHVDVEKRSGS
jgi:Flp pilus assembly secretin CpaC